MTGTDGLTDGREGVEVRENARADVGPSRRNPTKLKNRKSSGYCTASHHFATQNKATGIYGSRLGLCERDRGEFAGASEASVRTWHGGVKKKNRVSFHSVVFNLPAPLRAEHPAAEGKEDHARA